LCLVLGVLVAGPAVMALFPIWVIGALLAANADGEGRLQRGWAWLAYFGSLAIIVGVNVSGGDHLIRIYLHDHIPGYWRLGASQRLITDYLIGLAVLLHILSFSGLNPAFRRFFGRISPLARYLAGFSFTLYLFHRPMTQLTGYAFPNTEQSIVYSLACMLAILLACLLISYGTERQLGMWRAFFVRGFRKLPVFSGRP
jgi:peptidoglycan/LPS O-acetylase OafA/YrhL